MIGLAHSEKEMLASEFTPRKLFASTRGFPELTEPLIALKWHHVSLVMVKGSSSAFFAPAMRLLAIADTFLSVYDVSFPRQQQQQNSITEFQP